MWPSSYSSAQGLLTSIVLVPSESIAGGPDGELVVVGALPKDISAGTLRPFFDESFRSMVPPSSADGGGEGHGDSDDAAAGSDPSSHWASLVLTDGAGSPFYVTAARVGAQPGGATLAVCSAFPALSLTRHVLGLLLQAAAAAATAAAASAPRLGCGGGATSSGARLADMLHAAVYALPPLVPGLHLAVGWAPHGRASSAPAAASTGAAAAPASASAAPELEPFGRRPELRSSGLRSFAWSAGDGAPLDPWVCDDVCMGAVPPAALIGAWEALLFEQPVMRAAPPYMCRTHAPS